MIVREQSNNNVNLLHQMVRQEIGFWYEINGPVNPIRNKFFWTVKSKNPELWVKGESYEDSISRFEYKLTEFIIDNWNKG